MTRTFEVALTIPDNAAYTALVALRRLGFDCDSLERADIYVFDLHESAVSALERELQSLETIYNPNKHILRARPGAPQPGELWVGDIGGQGANLPGGKEPSMTTLRIAGRTLEGVHALARFTAWRLTSQGAPVSPAIAASAGEALLCNQAYQQAIVGQ
jgi:hypothetical protein